MDAILIFGGICLCLWLVWKVLRAMEPQSPNRMPRSTRPSEYSPPLRKDVYRPRTTTHSRSTIVFDVAPTASWNAAATADALKGLHDAFTGASLNPALGLHCCTNCQVYYHSESIAVLREENGSRCVACGSASVVAVTARDAKTSKGRDYNPDLVTLSNFRSHFDRVVTFEGTVREVKVSRRGKDYAVMFENSSWTKGLKLVFFRGGVKRVGGPSFISSLSGKNVRVRGLLINHPRFGPEIVVSERGMILSVR